MIEVVGHPRGQELLERDGTQLGMDSRERESGGREAHAAERGHAAVLAGVQDRIMRSESRGISSTRMENTVGCRWMLR